MIRHGWSVAVLVSALAGVAAAFAPLNAAAEIYGWVDPSGAVTYSNLPPPKNARVIDVIQETPPPTPQAQAAAEAAHQSEMRALNERVQQLERELQQTRWQAPPAPSYPASAPPSYGPPPGYAPTASYGPGCDPEFLDCDSWAGPVYYSVGLPYWGFRHHHDHDHDRGSHRFPHPGGGGPHFVGTGARAPAHGSGGFSGPMAHAH
jgi:hypothetical protein